MAVYKSDNPTKDGRSWYYVSYKNQKQYKSKKYKTKKEAQDEEAIFRLKISQPHNVLFKLVWLDYLNEISKSRKESTIYSYKKDYSNHIKDYFENLYINDITIANVRDWASKLEKKGLSVNYMNKIHNILNNIFDFGIKHYNLTSNPSRIFGAFQKRNDQVIEDKDKLRYITFEDFNTFISAIDDSLWYTFFNFAYYTGCRRGEIIALTWKDINFDKKEITINKTLYEEIKGKYTITSTKNNQNRIIKISKTLYDVLKKYKEEVSQYEDFKETWFIFGNTRFLPKTTIARNKHKYFVLSGLEDKELTMHEFRHSHVSLLINEYVKNSAKKNAKVDTAKFFLMMSNRMGHTIQVMQDTYMHLFPTIQDEIIDLLDNL